MACNVINSWTFTALVGAFLDLSIAYLLLCGSTLAYLASKFLGLFGKSLPCPCNGLFGYPHKSNCFQSTLVNHPHLKISTVQSSVMEKFPFDSIWNKYYDEEDDDYCQALFSPCNSKKNSIGAYKGRFRNQRPRVGLRRRKRVANGYGGKALSFSNDPLASNSINSTPTGFNASITTPNDSEDVWETSKEIELPKQGSRDFEVDDDPCIKNTIEKELVLSDFDCSTPDRNFDGIDKNAIRGLEQALDEEHEVRTALYLELEKERTAAATAADEAMAMIQRLQEEKATIEMEARQYQRMIEEKFAYDAEEMNILKEILLRREREKHFLEKEVEAYKQMFSEKEVSDTNMYDVEAIHEQGNSIGEQQVMPTMIDKYVGEKEKTMLDIDFPGYDYEINQEFEVKGMASENQNPDHQESYVQSDLSTTPPRSGLHEKTINTIVEEEQSRETSPHHCLTPKETEAQISFSYSNEKMEKHGEDLHGSDSGTDYHLLDVHVINDESDLPQPCDNRTVGGLEIERYKKSNSLDRSGGLPPFGPTRVKSLPPISRRNSMSAFDYQRLKIDSEVGWLRERLKIIQKGREKLNFPAENKEREHFQLQILENIASQIKEIRQLTEPRKQKALRRASLPHQSSKVMQRKEIREVFLEC